MIFIRFLSDFFKKSFDKCDLIWYNTLREFNGSILAPFIYLANNKISRRSEGGIAPVSGANHRFQI